MFDPLASLPGYLLRRASSASLAELNRKLAEIGINHVDASLLMLTGANPGLNQSEAGRILGIQRANMVPLVSRNEARGLLRRQKLDGRSQALFLSSTGEDILQTVHKIADRHEAMLIARVPEEMRPYVIPILRGLWME